MNKKAVTTTNKVRCELVHYDELLSNDITSSSHNNL